MKKTNRLLSLLMVTVLLLTLALPLAPSAKAAGPYNVSLDDIFNGSVTVDKTAAEEGEEVSFTATPAEGYALDSVSVYAIDLGQPVSVSLSGSSYVFLMPASPVQISASFKEAPVTHTVTFYKAAGGVSTPMPPAQTVVDGEKAVRPADPDGSADDATFLAWYTESWYSNLYDFDTPVTKDLELYAKWDLGPGYYYHDVFVENGSASPWNARMNTTITITANEPEAGKVFDKWVVEQGGVILADENSSPTTFTMVPNTVSVKATFKDAPAATYSITVNGGKAYKTGGVEITSAAPGDLVYIRFDDDAVPAGKYISWGSAVTDPAVSISLGMISGTEYQAGFEMPASDITVSPFFLDQKSVTVDLTSGASTDTTAASNAEWSLYRAEELGLITADFSNSYQEKFDLDKNSSWDVAYFSSEDKFSVLEGCSITGDKVLTIQAAEYSPVTFKFPASASAAYTITVNGGKAYNGPGAIHSEITSAEAGSKVYVRFDDSVSVPNGKYHAGFTSEQAGQGRYLDLTGDDSVLHFTMPAENVIIDPLFEDQMTLTVDLTSGSANFQYGVFRLLNSSFYTARTEGKVSINGEYVPALDEMVTVVDVDKDEYYDIINDIENGFSVHNDCSLSGDYVISGIGSGAPYTGITLKFPASAPVTSYPVWVGSTQVTSANKDDILGDGTASYTPGEGSGTLTFTTATPNITGAYFSALIYVYGIDMTINTAAEGLLLNGGYAYFKGNITINGNADMTIYCDNGDVTITGDLNVETASPEIILANDGNISIGGNVHIKNTQTSPYGHGLLAAHGKITMTSGVWDISANDLPLDAKNGIVIPGTHEITLPTDGVVTNKGSYYAVTESDGTTLAQHVIIEPKTVTYPVWVGSTQVTSANKDDILGDGGKAKFDPATNTLTLNNPAVTTTHENAAIYSEGIDLTVAGTAALDNGAASGIVAQGGNLTLAGNISAKGSDYGVFCAKEITVQSGTVTAAGSSGMGLYGLGGVTISGGTVTASGSTSGIHSNSSITISGGSVTATGGENGIRSNNSEGQITISGGTVTAKGTSGNGISGPCPISITGGTVEAEGGKLGIHTNRVITIGNGITRVQADGGKAIHGFDIQLGDALIIQEPAGGTVGYLGGGNTVLDGENAATHAVIVPGSVTPAGWTVTFDSQGGSPVPAQTVNDGEKATKPADPTRAGLGFVGWYKDSECTEAYDFDTPVTADITLYAAWKQYIYSLNIVKVWEDDDDAAGKRPDSVDVKVLADGTQIDTVTLKRDKGWKMLYVLATGEADLDLTCEEVVPAGYTLVSNVKSDKTVTLTNRYEETPAPPATVTYTVTGGANSVFLRGSGASVTITVKRSEADETCFDHFTGLQIDGITPAPGDFTAKAGSTVITFPATALQKLSDGVHTVTILFDDGSASTSLTVMTPVNPRNPYSPQTGDESNLGLWIALMVLSGTGLCAVALRSRKRRYLGRH